MVTLLLISVPLGFLGALTGLGGASILIPILASLEVPVKEAIASCMLTIIATSSGSVSTYVKEGIANVKVAFYLEISTTVGAMAGATITTHIPAIYLYFFFAAFLLSSFPKLRGALQEDFTPSTTHNRVSHWLELHGQYFDEAKVRVSLSVFYFALQKNVKYVLITLFVLTLLTLSLAVVPHP